MDNIEPRVVKYARRNPQAIAIEDPELAADFAAFLKWSQGHEQDGDCPFCGQYSCDHWDEIAWINPDQ